MRQGLIFGAFWVNPYGVAFDLMTVSDLLLIDLEGNVLEGTGKPGEGQICTSPRLPSGWGP